MGSLSDLKYVTACIFTEEQTWKVYGQEQMLLRDVGKVCTLSAFDVPTNYSRFASLASSATKEPPNLVEWEIQMEQCAWIILISYSGGATTSSGIQADNLVGKG